MREVKDKRGLPKVERTLLDRLVGWVDPVRGARRLQARMATTMLEGAWDGASKSSRRLAGWNAPVLSADAAIADDLPVLRDRSSELVRNNPLATGAIKTVVTRTIGTGLAMHPAINAKVLGLSDQAAEDWQDATKLRWSMWAERTWCDATRRLDFYSLQRLAVRSAFERGDAFALLPLLEIPGSPSPLAVMLVEADRIANPRGLRDTKDMVAGIRLNENGAPVACHVLREHPGALNGARLTLEGDWIDFEGVSTGRRNVLQLVDPERIGQTRGVPYLAPVMAALKQLGRYTDAEIDAAVISAFFAVFIKHSTGEGVNPMESAVDGMYPGTSDAPKGSAWDGRLTSGLAVDLPDGAEIESVAPGRPNPSFDPFVLAVLRQVGAALEIPFELLIKHFTSSYTAARAALLDFGLFVRRVRAWTEAQFCQPVYEEWLRIEVATGRIAAPGFFANPLVRHAWCGASWTGDAMGVLDPQRETAAIEKALELRLTTRSREAMLRDGTHWEETAEQLAREEATMTRLGIKPEPPIPAPAPNAPQPPRPGNNQVDGTDTEDSTDD